MSGITPKQEASFVAERLPTIVERGTFAVAADQSLQITVSVGVEVAETSAADARALYDEKRRTGPSGVRLIKTAFGNSPAEAAAPDFISRHRDAARSIQTASSSHSFVAILLCH